MSDPPESKCGFSWPRNQTPGSILSNENCCYRDTWKGTGRCLWHTDLPSDKPADQLHAQRETETNRLQNSGVRELLCGAKVFSTSLKNEIFTKADFTGAVFDNAILDGIYLKSAVLNDTEFHQSSIEDATLSDAQLNRADLTGVSARGTTLFRADLQQAILKDATLTNTNLKEADLTGADLTGADLTGADLRDATFNGAILTDAIFTDAKGVSAAVEAAADTGETISSSDNRGSSPVNSQKDESNSAGSGAKSSEPLTDIPGVGTTRATTLQGANYTSVSDIADVSIGKLSTEAKMSTETAKCIRLSAKEMRGDADTAIARISEEYEVSRESISDAYGSIVSQRGTFSEKIDALRHMCSNPQSILNLDGHSKYNLYSLYAAGFEEIRDVARAPIDGLTEVPYITHQAKEIRGSARELAGYSKADEPNKNPTKRNADIHICPDCGEEFKFKSVLRKHSYSCDKEQENTSSANDGETTEVTNMTFKGVEVSQDGSIDSTAVARLLDNLRRALETELGESPWFQRFIWDVNFNTPYLGPETPAESDYAWLGMVDEYYQSLSRASNALQLEFGLSGNSATGFLGKNIIWGIFFGPWADDNTSRQIKENLLAHSSVFSQFLTNHDEYVLVTKKGEFEAPSESQIETIAEKSDKGFALTLDLKVSELQDIDIFQTTCRTLFQLVPLYRLLAGIKSARRVPLPSELSQENNGFNQQPQEDDLERVTSPIDSGNGKTRTGGQNIKTPDELSIPTQEPTTTTDNVDVYPNYLTEYYEAFRNARKVLQLVFEIEGSDIDPDNRQDPRVQYYTLLDACIGFTNLTVRFTGYGPQHQDRLPFSVKDYCTAFGNGQTITDYQVIDVEAFKPETKELLRQKTPDKSSTEFVRPCVPGTEIPLWALPGSFEELQEAMLRLSHFPAYPPLQTESGVNDQTIPIAEIYQAYFGDLEQEYQVDLQPIDRTHESPPPKSVTDATPKSDDEAKAKLVDYGRLSHLFRRVSPPAGSPINRNIDVLSLDWYRPKSQSFDALQGVAKRAEHEPVDTFRPRLQDLIHRRFLLDDWEYDYITVFPGHEAESLSPQLVELARDSVIDTKIVYTPLLERTQTTERQRGKSKEGRQDVAIDPSTSLRARAKLDGETVILLDDICTTGSSLLAGAHLLRQAGAGRVVCLTLGLTPGGPLEQVAEITNPEAVISEIIAGGGE